MPIALFACQTMLIGFILARRHKHLPDPQRKDRAMQQAVYHRYFLDSR